MILLKRFKKNIDIFLVLLVLLFRVYFLITITNNPNLHNKTAYEINDYTPGDAHHYLVIAKNLLNHKTFSDNNSGTYSESSAWRPPVWPFILSIMLFFSNNLIFLITLKITLEVFLIYVIYKKVRKIIPLNSFYLLFFLLIEPQFLKYSFTFLSESVTSLWITLLLFFFLSLNKERRTNLAIPFVSAFTILCHPVSIFFVMIFFSIYFLINIKDNLKTVGIHALLFVILISLWPIRNQIVFNKGYFITSSQGSSLSKGWNEDVYHQFNNVNGDLANEALNLKYVSNEEIERTANSSIDRTKLYKKGTIKFIKQTSWKEKAQIIYVKIRSNFNPFPEAPKAGKLEFISSLFRALYLFLFIQVLFFLVKRRISLQETKSKVALFVFSIFLGQLFISSLVYTGLRFNSIYSLSMLLCFYLFNKDRINSFFDKVNRNTKNKLLN